MPEIAWIKPREAKEELLEKRQEINNYVKNLTWDYKIDEWMNFWAQMELRFPKWKYSVTGEKFEWTAWISPQITIEVDWREYNIKATKFLRILWKKEKRDELREMYNAYKLLKSKIQDDMDDLKPEKLEKVEEKTKWSFRKLFTQWKK